MRERAIYIELVENQMNYSHSLVVLTDIKAEPILLALEGAAWERFQKRFAFDTIRNNTETLFKSIEFSKLIKDTLASRGSPY